MPSTMLSTRDTKMTLSLSSRSSELRRGKKKTCSAKKLKPWYCICCYSGWPCPRCTSGWTPASGNLSHMVSSSSLGLALPGCLLGQGYKQSMPVTVYRTRGREQQYKHLKPQGEDKRKGTAKRWPWCRFPPYTLRCFLIFKSLTPWGKGV